MNRLPPSLLYLTIYNPTLQPIGPIDQNDEDAEEQAHILFYTSRERAVSRDRMLRQIGLAKALINFAEIFDVDRACENVHSQCKRLIMVSPESGFYIHAGIEVARQSLDPKAKSKSKSKAGGTNKTQGSALLYEYEYEDGSVHDKALRAHILNGYEKFKLTHGSFTSILERLGQQALELQLERFWTVWAWSWNLEEPAQFGEAFGPRLHPLHASLMPILNDFTSIIPENITPAILTRLHIIPSERYVRGHYSPALPAHFSVMIPEHSDKSNNSDNINLTASVDTIKGKHDVNLHSRDQSGQDGGSNFLTTLPTINMNIDVRKWNWSNYLTFGKPGTSKFSAPNDVDERVEAVEALDSRTDPRQAEVTVNAEDLKDAISSDSMSIRSKVSIPSSSRQGPQIQPSLTTSYVDELAKSEDYEDQPLENSPQLSLTPLAEYSTTTIHVAPYDNPTATERVAVHYMIRNTLMLLLINSNPALEGAAQDSTEEGIQRFIDEAIGVLNHIESGIYDGELKSASDSLPSATKILQPRDRYIMSTGQFTYGSPEFTSTSSHLFNAKAILNKDSDILEVFSRGQNPQHWHIAKSNLGNSTVEQSSKAPRADGNVYMEVFRKETSLTDVDNVLAGVVKKSGLVEITPSR